MNQNSEKSEQLVGGWGWEVPKDRPLNIVFMGTPDFAVPTLRALADSPHRVVAVYTQPDRPKGRGRKLHPPPVKVFAQERGIPVYQPEKMTSQEAYERLLSDAPDLVVVVAYGKILRPKILRIPPLGCINCHASLLPKYRGAAPIFWTLYNGETETGITTMWMNAGMDTGPILLQEKISIGKNETFGQLHDRLAQLSAELLMKTLDELIAGTLEVHPQDDSRANLAPMLKPQNFILHFNRAAVEVHNHIRALDPLPGAKSALPDGRLVKLFASSVERETGRFAPPGTVLSADRKGLVIACSVGSVRVGEIQPAGKKRMPVASFLAGNPLSVGAKLKEPESEL